jgi:hypothetical protein
MIKVNRKILASSLIGESAHYACLYTTSYIVLVISGGRHWRWLVVDPYPRKVESLLWRYNIVLQAGGCDLDDRGSIVQESLYMFEPSNVSVCRVEEC